MVSRSHSHAYPVVRGGQPRGMVRRQLPGLRGRQDAAAGYGFGYPAPAEVQEVFAIVENAILTDVHHDASVCGIMLCRRHSFSAMAGAAMAGGAAAWCIPRDRRLRHART